MTLPPAGYAALVCLLLAGCSSVPIAVRPSGSIGPARVAVEDDRPGRPAPSVIGIWFGSPIVLPADLTAGAIVSDAVGRNYPTAKVNLDVLWITSGDFRGEGPVPIMGHLQARVTCGRKSSTVTASAEWNAVRPTEADFRRVLDGLLGDLEATLSMMRMVHEL